MDLFSFEEESASVEEDQPTQEEENATGMPNILRALDERNLDYYNLFGRDEWARQKAWDKESFPALRWFSTVVGEEQVDWAEAKRQGRKKGDKKGPWPSTSRDSENTAYYVLAVNDTVNQHFWELKKHPKLLFLLMCFVGCGQAQQHKWLKMINTKKSKDIFEDLLVRYYPDACRQELDILAAKYSTPEAVESLAKLFGMPDTEIKKILEFKFGKQNASGKKKSKSQ